MENGVTWCVMSMMRASGAMPTMTALQMATESFAAPKSVMNTMVRCAAGPATSAGCREAGASTHESAGTSRAQSTAALTTLTSPRRLRSRFTT